MCGSKEKGQKPLSPPGFSGVLVGSGQFCGEIVLKGFFPTISPLNRVGTGLIPPFWLFLGGSEGFKQAFLGLFGPFWAFLGQSERV